MRATQCEAVVVEAFGWRNACLGASGRLGAFQHSTQLESKPLERTIKILLATSSSRRPRLALILMFTASPVSVSHIHTWSHIKKGLPLFQTVTLGFNVSTPLHSRLIHTTTHNHLPVVLIILYTHSRLACQPYKQSRLRIRYRPDIWAKYYLAYFTALN